jgi:hypothetical protein
MRLMPARLRTTIARVAARDRSMEERLAAVVGAPRAQAARKRAGRAKRFARRSVQRALAPVGFAVAFLQAVRTRARIGAFRQRVQVATRFPEPRRSTTPAVVVAVVNHVADPNRPTEESIERLERTFNGLLESFGDTRLELVLNTLPGRHVAAGLPDHLRPNVLVRERMDVEPMLLGFEAQREFVRRAGEADWFLYLEDDIVVRDALLLEKLEYFNAGAPPDAVLLPHRYEFFEGRKTYIDLVSKASPELCAWSRLTMLEIGGWQFAEFANPHSGFFALSRAQLGRWLGTGRRWLGKLSYMDPLVSAATGCLGEAFRIYKPHPANLDYLEVRHWDSKYSRLYEHLHGSASHAPLGRSATGGS